MELKLGLDIGTGSVGWGIIDENYDVKNCGVRLFTERTHAHNNYTPNNEDRRTARSGRRRIRRRQHRLLRMGRLLAEALGIDLPEPIGNIYEIRCRGLQEKLSKEELFLAIMHLTKRRGIHYLTPDDIKDEEENNTKKKSADKEKSTEEILAEQKEYLQTHYVCQLQYEKYLRYEQSLAVCDKVRGIENRFTHADYKKELEELLRVQSGYYPILVEHHDEIIKIYDSKREYDEGPGSEKSPTPYGRFYYDEQGEVKEISLIDKMRGHCTYYPEELRIAAGSYTACLFNLLNDLNNLTIQGNPKEDLVANGKLTEQAKRHLVDRYINCEKDSEKKITLKNIANGLKVSEADIRGYRVDKSDNPIFTKFEGYSAIYKIYSKVGKTDEIRGNRQLCDRIADILTEEKSVERRQERLLQVGVNEKCIEELANAKGFTGYHSLSQKAMERILDDLWETPNNQWVLFAELKRKGKLEDTDLEDGRKGLKGKRDIPFDGEDWIVSPVTKRATNEAVKVINAARRWIKRHYGIEEFSEIVIEVACDNNSQQEKKKLQDIQKNNEDAKKLALEWLGQGATDGQLEIARYVIEQGGQSLYSGKMVSREDVRNGSLEIEHIIPRSISCDNSQGNKVAAFRSENQAKGQRTPVQYIRDDYRDSAYQAYKNRILEWYKKCLADKRCHAKVAKEKMENLLYEGDPQKDMRGFINRNLVDTRYASKAVLKLLQEYYEANDLPTQIKTIRGATTHYFRTKANLLKDREATDAHHAQDALIIAGLSNVDFVQKMNRWAKGIKNRRTSNCVTGEIIEGQNFDDQRYLQFLGSKVAKVGETGENSIEVHYSYKVDRKPNRRFYEQTITATREIEGTRYTIKKFKNIYGADGKELKKKIQEHPDELLMFLHDKATFKKFQDTVNAFSVENPFAEHFQKHGPIRKYSRKEDGPEIYSVKYISKEAKGNFANPKQTPSVHEKTKQLRIDIYLDDGQYKFLRVPYYMIKRIENPKVQKVEYRIREDYYLDEKEERGISEEAKFIFSLYRGEIFSYEKNGEKIEWRFIGVKSYKDNIIEVKQIGIPSNSKVRKTEKIDGKITNLRKYHVDVLGNRYPATNETLQMKLEM